MNEASTLNGCLIATRLQSLYHLHLPRTLLQTLLRLVASSNQINDHYDVTLFRKSLLKLKNWEHLLLHIYRALKQMYV